MEIKKILLDYVDAGVGGGGGGGTSEIIDDQKMVTEWTVAMQDKEAARALFEGLVSEIKAKISSDENAAYGGDTQPIIDKFNKLVDKFDNEFIKVMNEQDAKLATATDLYKGFQGSMDSIFSGGEGGGDAAKGGAGAAAVAMYTK
ncbi:MAG: hypothetical protein II625_00775 [Bacilli bacterium]|nr:hypothetical protein [Bacilli bacterium]